MQLDYSSQCIKLEEELLAKQKDMVLLTDQLEQQQKKSELLQHESKAVVVTVADSNYY